MNKKEFMLEFQSNFLALRKILNGSNLIPGSPNDEFDSLNHQVLSHLYKGADSEKISRILFSELTTNYGLTTERDQVKELAEVIVNWWNLNRSSYLEDSMNR